MSSAQTTVEAVKKSLVVKCSPERAFEVFTREIGSWWPVAQHSIGGDKITEVVFEEQVGGRIYERHADGGEGEWGRVLAWEPPHRFAMSWYPGATRPRRPSSRSASPPRATAPASSSSTSGWEILGEKAADSRGRYDGGWAGVLGYFETAANS